MSVGGKPSDTFEWNTEGQGDPLGEETLDEGEVAVDWNQPLEIVEPETVVFNWAIRPTVAPREFNWAALPTGYEPRILKVDPIVWDPFTISKPENEQERAKRLVLETLQGTRNPGMLKRVYRDYEDAEQGPFLTSAGSEWRGDRQGHGVPLVLVDRAKSSPSKNRWLKVHTYDDYYRKPEFAELTDEELTYRRLLAHRYRYELDQQRKEATNMVPFVLWAQWEEEYVLMAIIESLVRNIGEGIWDATGIAIRANVVEDWNDSRETATRTIRRLYAKGFRPRDKAQTEADWRQYLREWLLPDIADQTGRDLIEDNETPTQIRLRLGGGGRTKPKSWVKLPSYSSQKDWEDAHDKWRPASADEAREDKTRPTRASPYGDPVFPRKRWVQEWEDYMDDVALERKYRAQAERFAESNPKRAGVAKEKAWWHSMFKKTYEIEQRLRRIREQKLQKQQDPDGEDKPPDIL